MKLMSNHARSRRLDDLGSREIKLGTKNPVPEAAGNTKAVLVVGEMMLQVILLEFSVVQRKARGKRY
jgi:hypothetical protein